MTLSRRRFLAGLTGTIAAASSAALRSSSPSSSGRSTTSHTRDKSTFRDYDSAAGHVARFYREHHRQQTYQFAKARREEYGQLNKGKATAWEMMEELEKIHDNSDPDISLSQKEHAFQVAERMRRQGLPDWMVVCGFVHDLGKALIHWGEPQWAVVGDTFPTGLKYSSSIVHYNFLQENPDFSRDEFQSDFGIYSRGIGLDRVIMTWGHDEYLYQVLSAQSRLPSEALFAIRFHSLYPLHTENDPRYGELMNESDRANMKWVKILNDHDLYSKDNNALSEDIQRKTSYYKDLVNEYIPGTLKW